jgi:hypothetical protein
MNLIELLIGNQDSPSHKPDGFPEVDNRIRGRVKYKSLRTAFRKAVSNICITAPKSNWKKWFLCQMFGLLLCKYVYLDQPVHLLDAIEIS